MYSNIHQLFYTNDPPDEATTTEVREIIARSKVQLEQGNHQMLTSSTIERHQALLSPLRRLPPEILCEIFIATKNASYDMCIHDLDARLGAWVLGRVCSRWREIALTCRPLWTTLDVALSSPAGHSSEKHSVDVLHEYLRRSGEQALDVSLLFAYRRSPRDLQEMADMTKLLDIIVAQSHRWKSLRLDMNGRLRTSECVLGSLARARGRLPLLQRMDFGLCQDLSDVDIILDSAPLLQDLSTTFGLNAERIPWEQLTRYVHDFQGDPVDYSWVFRHTPSLVECRIEAKEHDTGSSSEHTTLSDLRHLHVGATEPLDILTAPYLEYLTAPACDSHLISFIRRSPTLHSLTITGSMKSDSLIPLLKDLTSIEILALFDVYSTNSFFEKLACATTLPRLRILEMECFQLDPINAPNVFNIVEKRQDGALQSASISISSPESIAGDDWKEQVQIYKKAGYFIDFIA